VRKAPSARGRPRDAGIERRALAAAREIYAERGLAGFTFDAVAARASIGKPALYRRWANKEDLLLAALAESLVDDAEPRASLPDDLRAFLDGLAALLARKDGLSAVRILIDARSPDGTLGPFHERVVEQLLTRKRDMTARAIARGELPPSCPLTLPLELAAGAVLVRALSAPGHGLPDRTAFTEELLTAVLRAVEWRPAGSYRAPEPDPTHRPTP